MIHKPAKNHGASDILSQNPDHHKTDEEDNLGQVMLKPEHVRISASQQGYNAVVADKGLLQRIRECSEKDKKKWQMHWRRCKSWDTEQGLILYQGNVYIPKNA